MNHCRPLVYNTKYKGKMCAKCVQNLKVLYREFETFQNLSVKKS